MFRNQKENVQITDIKISILNIRFVYIVVSKFDLKICGRIHYKFGILYAAIPFFSAFISPQNGAILYILNAEKPTIKWRIMLYRSNKKYTFIEQCEGKGVRVIVLNATFNSISVISRQSVLLVEETGVHGENHRPVACH